MNDNWKDVTEMVQKFLPEVEKLYESTAFEAGTMKNRNFIIKVKGNWKLELKINFVSIDIPLQEDQVNQLLNGGSGTTFHANITSVEKYTTDSKKD